MSERIRITIRSEENNAQYELLHDTGKTLLETMREGTVLLPSLCSGLGKCGKCMVRFCSYAPFPTQTDRSMIAPDKLREGYRLACTARPRRECVVEADFVKEKAEEEGRLQVVTEYYAADGRSWGEKKFEEVQMIRENDRGMHLVKESADGMHVEKRTEEMQVERRAEEIQEARRGEEIQEARRAEEIQEEKRTEEMQQKGKNFDSGRTLAAADIGTTTIAMQLIEIGSGCIRDTFTSLNPQRSYGMDVISRIKASNEGRGETLRKLVRDVLSSGLEQLRQSARKQGMQEPELLCIACNTAMGHIFMGYSTETLGKSPFLPVDIKTTVIRWGGIDVIMMPGISAFVGGDIAAGLYACGLCRPVFEKDLETDGRKEEAAWLFMDLGTNAEMVMGTGHLVGAGHPVGTGHLAGTGHLVETGHLAGTGYPMGAGYLVETGYRVAATAAAAGPAFEGRGKDGTVGSKRICAIADLLERGIADETGLLKEPYFETGIEVELEKENGRVYVTQEDIRDIQMAKAAVRAGIHFLMEQLGIKDCSRIEKVYIAGGMGFYLDKKAAVRIGLLPAELAEKMEVVGNTALAGAGLFGRISAVKGWQKYGMELENYANHVEAFHMAELTEFEEVYIGYMNFDSHF